MNDSYIIYKIKELDKAIIRNMKLPAEEISNRFHVCGKSTPTQMKILGYIIDNYEKDIYQKDLEEVFNLSRATISDVLRRMENNGLITREQNPNDVRSKKINLSEGAYQIFEVGRKRMDYIEKKAIRDIPSSSIDVFVSVIDKMISNIYEK